MKAIRYETFGPPEVLQFKEVAQPAPKEHQVLVKVHAASINALEWRRFHRSLIRSAPDNRRMAQAQRHRHWHGCRRAAWKP